MYTIGFFKHSVDKTVTRDETVFDSGFKDSFLKHYPALVGNLTMLLGNRHDAEDIAQEAFIKLFRAREVSNIGAWLKKTAVNTAINFMRSNSSRTRREEAVTRAGSDKVYCEDMAFRNIEADIIRDVLRQLAQRDRDCLLLKMSGFDYNEIGDILGVKRRSVGTLVSRAQQRFKREYEKKTGGAYLCATVKASCRNI